MKITIEIEVPDGTVVTSSDPGAGSSTTSQRPAPPEVIARAQALGASDGGAAPAELPQAGAPPVPAAIAGLAAAAPPAGPGGEGAISAGAAPLGPAEVPSQTVEQDPEAPSGPDEES